MAGKCKYCGFFGTQDEIVNHAGSCPVMLEGYQPDTREELENGLAELTEEGKKGSRLVAPEVPRQNE